MTHGMLARHGRFETKRLQRKPTRRQRIPKPMLVMNGERLDGLARDVRRAAVERENPLPRAGGISEAAEAPRHHGIRPKRFRVRNDVRRQLGAAAVCGTGEIEQRAALVQATEPERLARVSRCARSFIQEL